MKHLTKAEEQVMQILWDIKQGFVKDVLDKMPSPKPAYNTVSTIIRILEKKGFVDYKAYGKTHEYFPIIEKNQYRIRDAEDFVKSVKSRLQEDEAKFRKIKAVVKQGIKDKTITFDDILHLFKVGELDMEDYAQAFGYLSSLLVAHERLLNHMSLTKAELALLAGLKSERTISNEISKGTLKKTEAGGYVSYESAIEWLHDKDIKRRRREWKDLIGSPLHLEEILEKL